MEEILNPNNYLFPLKPRTYGAASPEVTRLLMYHHDFLYHTRSYQSVRVN